MDKIHFAKSGKCENEAAGPTLPIPGPTFPIAEATALIDVKKSTPIKVNISEPTVKINKYKIIKASRL